MSSIISTLGSLLLTQIEFTRILESGKQLQDFLEGFSIEESLGMRAEVPALPLVIPFGSCVSGTAFKDADVDYTVVFVPRAKSVFESHKARLTPSCFLDVNRQHHHEVLSSILQRIKKVDPLWCLNHDRIFLARVPIVRLKKKSLDASNVDNIDISLSLDGIRNSTLLRFYMQSDPRLRAGALCAKKWGRSQKILNARQGWISPYAVTIMYIFFMQQTGRTRSFIDENKVDEFFSSVSQQVVLVTGETQKNIFPVFNEVLPFHHVNDTQILEDLQDFFDFFGDPKRFDFDADVVDIRTKNKISSKENWQAELIELTDKDRWNLLGYETIMVRDPFESHNLGRSVDFFRAEGIRETFRLAAKNKIDCLITGDSLLATF